MTTVIKIGGSLIPHHVALLCRALNEAPPGEQLVLVAGGGDIVEVIRGYRRTLGLANDTTYAMALLSMDQHAYLLAALGNFPMVRTLQEVATVGAPVCVLAPAREIHEATLGEAVDIDRATSDSIAATIAAKLGARLIVMTDVDGIYSRDPKAHPDAELLEQVHASALLLATSLDAEAAAIIRKHRVKTIILNGTAPARLIDYLAGRPSLGTEIFT